MSLAEQNLCESRPSNVCVGGKTGSILYILEDAYGT